MGFPARWRASGVREAGWATRDSMPPRLSARVNHRNLRNPWFSPAWPPSSRATASSSAAGVGFPLRV